MRRIRYYPTIDDIVHLAENYNVNVNMESQCAYLYPTDEAAAAECSLMGLPEQANETSCHDGDRHDLDTWAYNMNHKSWMNYDNRTFVTYHV